MRIVDHQPSSWFLAEEDDALFLDVNCSNGPVGFSVLVKLTDDERGRIARDGRGATAAIAREIEDHTTAARGLGADWQARFDAAVTAWAAARIGEVSEDHTDSSSGSLTSSSATSASTSPPPRVTSST